jgi:hypothetical protein
MLAAASLAVVLAILALSLLLCLLAWQNRDLPARLRATGRAPWRVLAEAFRLWTPLALAIVAATAMAHALSAAGLALVYRTTPLQAWCVLRNAEGQPAIPCTDRGPREPRAALERLPRVEAASRRVLERYAQAMDRQRDGGTDAAAAFVGLSPPAILGLPLGPQDDPELQRLRRELQALVDTPAVPARSPLDILRARGDAEIRTRRLGELTRQVIDRRDALAAAAYGGRPRAEQGRLWLQHRLAHELLATQSPLEAATAASERRADLRRGKLLADAAASLEVFARHGDDRLALAALGIAWPTPAWCRFRGAAPVFPCPRIAEGEDLDLQPLPADENLRLSLAAWRGESRREGLRVLGRAALSSRRGLADASAQVAALPVALRQLAFPPGPPCSLLAPGGCAQGWLGAGLERALAPGGAWGAQALDQADDAVELRLGAAAASLWRDIDRVQGRAQALGEAWLQLHARLRLAGWLLLAFLAARSFLYVLALASFRHGGPQWLGLGGDAGVEGEVHVGGRLTLDPEFGGALLTHRQLSNSDNHLRLAPWPGSAPIARLLHGRYLWFTRGRLLAASHAPPGGLGRIASADGGRAIVEWRLRPGEQVVFGWRDFFGASENLRFRTRLSFRLSTLLLGRVLFRIAEAPAGEAGVLLLRAYVEQGAGDHLQAVPPERLLAWNRQARFTAHGAHTAWGVLWHGLTLVRDAGGGGHVLASSEDRGARFGSLRFLRRIVGAVF